MEKTGTKLKHNSLKQQRVNAELESIIEEFGFAMHSANRFYVIMGDFSLTPNMKVAWYKYVDFCLRNPNA